MPTREFWAGQRVFLTGHTGFKGSWASRWLSKLGATQTGYALAPDSEPALFPLLDTPGLTSVIGDIRDPEPLAAAVAACDPTIAIHMAAQPLVRLSYREPAATYATNVMGTLNVLEALRHHAPSLKAVLVITTDKVYANDNSGHAFVEEDRLGGHDPYSSSKAACEEVVSSYRQSFYDEKGVRLATARAGNVIGGGDWSEDRLIPDIWRAMDRGEAVVLRNPDSVRPWQHVLDPVSGYLDYVEAMTTDQWATLPRALNFAPVPDSPMTVREVTESLGDAMGIEHPWLLAEGAQPVEMKLLTLDASLANRAIGWRPRLTGREAVEWTADWIRATRGGESAEAAVDAQIRQYEELLSTDQLGVSQ
ncbi:CDP-glucose 4,6-dehydratase [Nocardioides sp. Kera G14]|uniref:CDP-glucose 4,6-dehydratase n=1 Tax=Nocardioides sp. Kera G14 TaxID=2884264 RepID=UPI001D11D272|nr:CDP-glucose 4,6-dehydratase [Nocardioides sp. Kera G14]UDY23109.1 CDP-glucose 4,6-dehydratase [Nocardioides sp. Kera G14]